MTEPENAHCFSEPHWLVIARGKDVEKWFNDDQAVGTGGILSPQPTHLSVGQRYYRFANSTSSEGAQIGGGWWIEYESFKTIETFARSNATAWAMRQGCSWRSPMHGHAWIAW